jgi:Transposase/HTH-like domain
LKEHEAGVSVSDLCCKHGVSDASIKWKAKFGGMEVSEAKRLRALEDENAKLKRMLGRRDAGQRGAERPLGKEVVTPASERKAVAHLVERHGMSERRACKAIGSCRMRYKTTRADDAALRDRMKAIAVERRRFGYRRLHVMLKREGFVVNHKRLFRLYREERLTVRRRGGRKRALGTRRPIETPSYLTNAGAWTSCPTNSPTAAASASWPSWTTAVIWSICGVTSNRSTGLYCASKMVGSFLSIRSGFPRPQPGIKHQDLRRTGAQGRQG